MTIMLVLDVLILMMLMLMMLVESQELFLHSLACCLHWMMMMVMKKWTMESMLMTISELLCCSKIGHIDNIVLESRVDRPTWR